MKAQKVNKLWWLLVVPLFILPVSEIWAAGTPAGTVITNMATLSYKDANGNALPNINSNAVTTIVSQVAGVDVTPATLNNYIVAGGSDVFPIYITNMGNGSDTFNLSYTALPAGWTGTLYGDANSNGVLDPDERVPGNIVSSVALAADSTKKVFLYLTAPADAPDGETTTVTLTATSTFDSNVTDTGNYTATVQTAVLSVTKSASVNNPKPGDVVTYAIDGINSGSSTAHDIVVTDVIPAGMTYVPGSIRIEIGAVTSYDTAMPLTDSNDGDMADFGVTAANTVTVNWGDSPAGQQGTIFFRAVVNANIPAGTVIGNVARIVYTTTPGGALLPEFTSNTENITVAAKPSITLSNLTMAKTGQPGDQVVYAFTITNNGNSNDNFNFTFGSTQGYTRVIWNDVNADGIPGNDGDYILTDTNADGMVNTPALVPGQVVNIIVVVTIPPGSENMAVDATTVTVASTVDPTITANVVLTTTVHAPVLSVVKSVSPSGNQPPGTVLTYSVVITNTGNGTATALQLVDNIPNNTTYVPGSITYNGSPRTDAVDGDNAIFIGNAITVNINTLGPGGSATITFQVTIN